MSKPLEANGAGQRATTKEATMAQLLPVGSLVEADVVGTPGTFRVIEGHREPEAGSVWIRETGLHLRGQEPFVIEWLVERIRLVEAG